MSKRQIQIATQGVVDEIGPWFGDFTDDFDLEAIVREFADAIEAKVQAATSDEVVFVWTAHQSPYVEVPVEIEADAVIDAFNAALESVDLEAIAGRHEK